jgi:DNA polymerase III subunit beta
MRATVERKAAATAAKEAKRATSRRPTLPALSGVLLTAEGGTLTVQATDLSVSYTERLAADVEQEGRVLLPAGLLATILPKLDGTRVTIEVDGEANRVRVTDDAGADAEVRPMLAEDFPKLAEPGVPFRDVPGLLDALKRVRVAASTDEGRPILTGVRLAADEVAATDAYRLAVATVPGLGLDHLVPAHAVAQVLAAYGARKGARVQVAGDPGQVSFRDPDLDRTWTCRLIEGTFPSYRALLPDTWETYVDVATGPLVKALARVSTVTAGQSNTPVSVECNGTIRLSATSQELGTYAEHVPASKAGPDVTIALNPAFLKDGLAMFGDRVGIELRDGLKPAVLTDGGTVRYLLMPMRVS